MLLEPVSIVISLPLFEKLAVTLPNSFVAAIPPPGPQKPYSVSPFISTKPLAVSDSIVTDLVQLLQYALPTEYYTG